MVTYDEDMIKKVFEMYVPEAIYLTLMRLYPDRANSCSSVATARIVIPQKPVYLSEGVEILHINNTDAAFIINQMVFGFYRWVLLNGELDFAKMTLEEMRNFYDRMFIKREIHKYSKFTPRDVQLTAELWHIESRKVGNAQMIWCKVLVPGFLEAEIVGGVKLAA